MSMDSGVIRQDLMAHDDAYRQLVSRHHELESQLDRLKQRRFLTADEEAEEMRIKKLKLRIKDEMEQKLRRRMSDAAEA